jgi:glycerol-3-phosphate dehydrogenase
MANAEYDLCVIGGGVNGAGIARDAAGRGLSVILVEAKDLAQGTSSASTKLVHGGLRYLEFMEFNLVRESLIEREKLLRIAPHIIWPMKFILPHSSAQRPYWMVRLGLFLYDHLARRNRIGGSGSVDLKTDAVGAPLSGVYKKAFSYHDCWVDDARLVALNALDAAERGADIRTHTKCTKIKKLGEKWLVSLQDQKGGDDFKIRASMVVNAAGPWVREVIENNGFSEFSPNIRLVKGSHIIIKRAYEGDHSYILQQDDGRIVFAIPYEGDYTLVGTTEEAYSDDLYDVRISDDEIGYLCSAISTHFKRDITRDDVLWTYSGVRPLFDDGESDQRKVTRDFVLHDHTDLDLPMISVFGGKITTYRVLAEKVVNKLLHLDARYSNPWTDEKPLPGGEFLDGDVASFVAQKRFDYPWIPDDVLYRYVRLYGTRMDRFLEGAKDLKDLGRHYGGDVYEAELAYLVRYEFVRDLEDALWRRTKLGLHISDETYKVLKKDWPKIVKRMGHG